MPVEARNFHQPKHPAGVYTEDGTERVLHINFNAQQRELHILFFFIFTLFDKQTIKEKNYVKEEENEMGDSGEIEIVDAIITHDV